MRKLTNEEFLNRIDGRPITSVDDYVASNLKIRFKCNVDGNIWSALPASVMNGSGCPKCATLHKANAIKAKHANRVISDKNGWLEVDVSTPKFKDAVMKIDAKDWHKIKPLCGKISASNTSNYTLYATGSCGGDKVRIHRLIIQTDLFVDHINHNGLDNRRINLREATPSQNIMNCRLSKRNSSGFKGVYFDGDRKKYTVTIFVKGKQIYLGRFADIEDAREARKAGEATYFGEFSCNTERKETR